MRVEDFALMLASRLRGHAWPLTAESLATEIEQVVLETRRIEFAAQENARLAVRTGLIQSEEIAHDMAEDARTAAINRIIGKLTIDDDGA